MTDDAAQDAVAERHEQRWLQVVLGLLFTLLLMNLNLFGHITAVERYGQQLFNQLFAPSLYGDGSRERISVTLLTDRDLETLKWSWPAQYGDHAGILREIRELEPLAVMIDLLFIDEREDVTIEELVAELERFNERKIPVFLASLPVSPTDYGIRPDLGREFAESLVPVPGLVGGNGYPLFYVHCDSKGGGAPKDRSVPECPDQVVRASAVARMYSELLPEMKRRFCKEAPKPPFCAASPLDVGALATAHPQAQRIELFWGANPDRLETRECNSVPKWFLVRFGRLAWFGSDAYRLECPFTLTVPAARFLLGHQSDLKLKEMIHDRVVFYGSHLVGSADIVQPPAHQPQAGVYAQAMAFDNLLTFGRNYKREGIALSFKLGALRIVAGAIVLGLLLWMALWVRTWLLARADRIGISRMIVNVLIVDGYTLLAAVGVALVLGFHIDRLGEQSWEPGLWVTELTPHGFQVFIVVIVQGLLLWPFLEVQEWWLARRARTLLAQTCWQVLFYLGYALIAVLVILAITVWIGFAWLNLIPGNWLEAVLELIGGKHAGEYFALVGGKIVEQARGVRATQAGV